MGEIARLRCRIGRMTLVAIAALGGSSPAAAQPAGSALELLPWERAVGAEPGSWVEYALLIGGHPVGPYLRFLVVGDESDQRGSWIELWISQRPGSATQAYRMLVARDERGQVGVRRTFARLLGGEVRELEPEELFSRRAGSNATAPRASLQWRGSPSMTTAVQTPAGSFTARELRLEDRAGGAKAWFSEEVPIFGLVRFEVAGQLGLELHALGTDGEGVISPVAPRPATPID